MRNTCCSIWIMSLKEKDCKVTRDGVDGSGNRRGVETNATYLLIPRGYIYKGDDHGLGNTA